MFLCWHKWYKLRTVHACPICRHFPGVIYLFVWWLLFCMFILQQLFGRAMFYKITKSSNQVKYNLFQSLVFFCSIVTHLNFSNSFLYFYSDEHHVHLIVHKLILLYASPKPKIICYTIASLYPVAALQWLIICFSESVHK